MQRPAGTGPIPKLICSQMQSHQVSHPCADACHARTLTNDAITTVAPKFVAQPLCGLS